MLTVANQKMLLDIADRSIRLALEKDTQWVPESVLYPEQLNESGACFVTLKLEGQLRGCIGSLEAYRPLIQDVAENAYAAAFRDPRFSALTETEYQNVTISISVLTKPEPMDFRNEADLISRITPGVDGLVLEAGEHRGTFLPAVWESLPDPQDFINQLKLKAGLPIDFWSADIKISRYRSEEFSA